MPSRPHRLFARARSLGLAALPFALSVAQAQTASDAAPPAPAPFAPVIYGLIDASGARMRPVGGGDSRWTLESGAMSRSFLGFRGAEDLGGGLRAVWKLESYLRVDTGQSGLETTPGFWSREANVGLSGQFGTTVIGRTVTPVYNAVVDFNPFGESSLFSPARRQYFGGLPAVGDRAWSNSIAYTNNPTDPFRVRFGANLPESQSAGRNFGGSIGYVSGPFAATLAGERVKNLESATAPGFKRQQTIVAGATYDIGPVRLYGQAGDTRTDATINIRTRVYQAGTAVRIGNGLVLASYGHATTKILGESSTDRIASLGYDYYLSRHTDLYAVGSVEKRTDLSTGHAVAGGVRVRF
jgi:predicted porin